MKEAQRRAAIATWSQLFAMPDDSIDAQERYEELLTSADSMEQQGLINSQEWRGLAQQAGTLSASTAECMRETNKKRQIGHAAIQWWTTPDK